MQHPGSNVYQRQQSHSNKGSYLLSTFTVTGTSLTTPHISLNPYYGPVNYHSHFTGKETKAHRDSVIFQR